MKNQSLKILTVIRMLASRNGRVTVTFNQEYGDTVEKLSSEGIVKDTKSILEIPSPENDPSLLQQYFSRWFKSHNGPPSYVAIKDFGTISITVPANPDVSLQGRICIITGAGQGFGAGIAEKLFQHGAQVIIADINDTIGKKQEELLNSLGLKNRALFIKTDVSDPESVEKLVEKTVLHFGGLDIMISNAGILRAGGLDEMNAETFRLMTEVNYSGFFYCTKYASEVMKIQTEIAPHMYCDILQINSKSGLQGSKKNFTYAGGKFGGIGLTQSFALELMPFHIKVNAICPGNFFEGPLWSDPTSGLFVQYLKAGKVPGAKTVQDVKEYYEKQVPAGRGCKVDDVVKAILYAVDQEYETGQAIPVTGGQVMLH